MLRGLALAGSLLGLIAGSARGQVVDFVKPSLGGRLQASQFDRWGIPATVTPAAPGSVTVKLAYGQVVLPDNGVLYPLRAGNSVLLDDASGSETVVIASTDCTAAAGSCQLQAVTTRRHDGPITVRSGTHGLEEAIQALPAAGGIVDVGPNWEGNALDILQAVAPQGVMVDDQQAGGTQWYAGSGAGLSPIFGITATGISAQAVEQVRQWDQFPGANLTAQWSNLLAGLPVGGSSAAATGLAAAVSMPNGWTLGAAPMQLHLGATVMNLGGQVGIAGGGTRLLGAGSGQTVLRNAATGAVGGAAPGLVLGSQTGSGPVQLADLALDRAQEPTAAISGDNGLILNGVQQPSEYDRLDIRNFADTGAKILGGIAPTLFYNPFIRQLPFGFAMDCASGSTGACQNLGVVGGAFFGTAGGVRLRDNSSSNWLLGTDIEGDNDPLMAQHFPALDLENAALTAVYDLTATRLAPSVPAATVYLSSANNTRVDAALINAQAGPQSGLVVNGPSAGTTITDAIINGNSNPASNCVQLDAQATSTVAINVTCQGFAAGHNGVMHSGADGTLLVNTTDLLSGYSGFNYYGSFYLGTTNRDVVMSDGPATSAAWFWRQSSTGRLWLGGSGAEPSLKADLDASNHQILGAGQIDAAALSLGGDAAMTSNPRISWSAFFPGALTATWEAALWTPDRNIEITRLQAAAKTAPAGCATPASISVTQGSAASTLLIGAGESDSGPLALDLVANQAIRVSVGQAASGCGTAPADVNVVVQYRMR